MVKTKIIATLGPSSSSETVLKKMVQSGLDVARLNFSHGTWEERQARVRLINKLNKKYHRTVKILLDLEGPRLRVGRFKNGKPRELKKGKFVWLKSEAVSNIADEISCDYRGSFKSIKKGYPLFIDDGNMELKVVSPGEKKLKAQVVVGGLLKERKGINIPDAELHFKAVTEKDKRDLEFAVKNQVDYVAMSFVRSGKDLAELKKILAGRLPQAKLVAKIENKEAVRDIEAIIAAFDGIMVARGDMGVSLPIWQVPIIQKQIIKKCNRYGKFVITATQMLESMTEHLRPTRAEVSDVANAVLDGTDFVMLSGETAAGQYPVETVRMMNHILEFTEQAESYAFKV